MLLSKNADFVWNSKHQKVKQFAVKKEKVKLDELAWLKELIKQKINKLANIAQ